jgi:hypothetical protein
MRILQMFMLFLMISAQPSIVSAGQSVDNGTKGTGPEHECDYITLPDIT